jgi:hypothetical protein
MPRRKTADVEILPPDGGRKKMVEAEHTIKYSAPVPVTVEENPTEDLIFEEDLEDVEKKRKRKTARDEREDLRREMEKLGVASVSNLKLMIEKYKHSDSTDSGTLADKDYCTKYACTREHILSEDYLGVASKWGPGRYWFTLRLDNKIVKPWEKEIGAPTSSGDPTSPPAATTGENQQPMSFRDIMRSQKEAFKEQLEMAKLMREAYGLAPDQTGNPARSEEEVVASAILNRPEIIDSVVGGVIKRYGGASGKEDEPWYAPAVIDAVKNGTAVQLVKTAIDSIFSGLQGLFPKGANNGQAQVSQTPLQNQTRTEQNQQHNQFTPSAQGTLQPGDGSLGSGQTLESRTPGEVAGDVFRGDESQMALSPEDTALRILIDDCMRKIPAKVTFNRLMAYADAVNEQAPQYSIDGYIDMFASMPTEAALEYVKTLPNGEAVTSLPHSKEWTEQLQKLITESQEVEE